MLTVGLLLDEGAGCAHYRGLMPGNELIARGYNVIRPEPNDLFMSDLVVGQRVMMAEYTKIWQRLADEGYPLVYDLDDDLFSIDPRNPAFHLLHEFKPGWYENLIANLERATMVTVTTEALAGVVSKYNPNVVVLPNMIDASLLDYERKRPEKVTVGWSGSACHGTDWASACKAIGNFLAHRQDVDLHLVGADYRTLLGRPDARHTEWAEPALFHKSLDFDIGVIPLDWHVFNRSKSDIKLLEMSALGIPVVASNYGPYGVIEHGSTGFLVDREPEWKKYLTMLADDAELREQVGARAKAWAATRTIQGNIHRWEQVYIATVAAKRGIALV